MNKYYPLDVDYELPEIIQLDIAEMLDYMNANPKEKQLSVDLYQSNLCADLNAYDNLPSDIVSSLKEYYCRGGIYERYN